MKNLQTMIKEQGQVFPGNVLKVDSFLNHQIDPELIKAIALDFAAYFNRSSITKIVTIEASGIAPALMLASHWGIPMLFAKKSQPSTLKNDHVYHSPVYSYTKQTETTISIDKAYLTSQDRILIIDDFLAQGQAVLGLVEIAKQAGAQVAGVGICIEKSFQAGRSRLETAGLDVYSICRIAALDQGKISFLEEDKFCGQ
ncbi:xanthine phosphoribosyltransferase [Eremococcus coleocola]|uniref:xanthine phosphoribosyltransferase n=1 Tax=Eremococcus coleocola TaxID=88132 RepID=UPI00041A4442|nr:xanthine phosphoribosyltransferase [Eremococcus coleocola]